MAEGMTETTKRLKRIERLVCEEYGFVWIDEPEEYVADLKAAGALRKHSFRWAVEMAFVEGLRRAEEIVSEQLKPNSLTKRGDPRRAGEAGGGTVSKEHICKPSCHNPCLLEKEHPSQSSLLEEARGLLKRARELRGCHDGYWKDFRNDVEDFLERTK